MHFVYIIVSVPRPDRYYVGLTENVRQRLSHHNEGIVRSTARFRPWRLRTTICFTNRTRAADFEGYLKTGSGLCLCHGAPHDLRLRNLPACGEPL
jgi:putative endonuclease